VFNDRLSDDIYPIVGNDGSIITEERNTYPYMLQPSVSVTPLKSNKGNILSSIRSVFDNTYWSNEDGITSIVDRSALIDGYHIQFLTADEISQMSLSTAESILRQIKICGYLLKKGFRRLRLWRKRYFVLQGNVLVYYDVFYYSTIL